MKGRTARRILSSILSVAMILSMLSMTIITADAADNRVVQIRIKDVVRKYADAADIYTKINEKREELGSEYSSFTLDNDLSDESMVRAAELVIKTRSEDLNFGNYAFTYLTNFEGVKYSFYEAVLKTTGTVDDIVDQLFSSTQTMTTVKNLKAKEIGIGVITINGDANTKYVCVRTTDSLAARNLAAPISASEMKSKGDVATVEETVAAVDFLKVEEPSTTYGEVFIDRGETKELYLKVNNYDENGSYAYVIPYYSVTPTGILSYDTMGHVTGKGTGVAQLEMILPGEDDSAPYSKELTINVRGEDFTGCTATYKKQATYKGTAILPAVTIKDSSGTTLKEGTDYTISYSNNIKVGTATILVTGLGERYGAKMELPFEILPKPGVDIYVSASKVSVGDVVRVELTGSNGLTPYSYQLTYTDPSNKSQMLSSADGKFTIVASAAGEYKLTAKLTDADNVSSEATDSFLAADRLSVSFDEEVYEDNVGKKVALSVTPSGGIEPIHYSYTYEDGSVIASGQDKLSTIITLSKAGEKLVIVTATDSIGNTATAQVMVKAIAPLNAVVNSTEDYLTLGDKAVISAESTGGYQPVTYSFINTDTNEPVSSVDGAFEFNPTEPGTYTFEVTATDRLGNFTRASKTIRVAESLSASLTANATEVLAGKKVTFTTQITGGFPNYTYKYAYSTGESFPGTAATTSYTFNTAGDYTIVVSVKDASGTVATDEVTVKVRDKLSISMTASAEKAYTNEDVTLTVNAAGGFDPATVTFEYSDGTPIPSNGNVAVFKPKQAGTLKIVATYLDKNGNSVETNKTITAADPLSVSLEPDRSHVIIKEKVTLTSKVTGGFPKITYSYTDGSGNPINGAGVTLGQTPTEAGSYTVRSKVTDAMGSEATSETTYYAADPITVSATTDTKYVNLGSSAAITLDATGGFGGYTYEFKLKDGTLLPTNGNKGIFTPEEAGSYVITPTVIDQYGNRKSAANITIVAAEKLSLESFTASTTRTLVGTAITFTTTVNDGFPKYTYSYAYEDGTTVGGSGAILNVTPKTEGEYTLIVTVTDLGGNQVTARKSFTVAPKLTIAVTASDEAIFLGKSSEMETTVTGGYQPYTYEYTYEDGTVIPSNGSKASVKPNENGVYKVMINVKDAAGFPISSTKTIRVADELLLSVDASATEAFVGDTVTYTRESSGGFPTVKFAFTCDNGGRITVADNVGTFKPTKAGNYTITVTATDNYKHVVTVTHKLEVVEPLTITAKPAKSVVYTGEETVVTVVPKGGFTPIEYQFSSDGGVLTADGDTATFKSAKEGEYTISVTAIDRNKNRTTTETKITVAPPMKLTLEASAAKVLAGTKVTYTATAEGGYDTVTFQYYLDGKTVSSSNGVYTASLSAVGDHVVSVTAKDKGGNTVTAEKALSVAAKMAATMDASYSEISLGESVVFTANVTGGFEPYTYSFAKEDGTVLYTAGNPATIVPDKDGSYPVIVTVKDAVGNVITASKSVTVFAELGVSLDASATEIIAGGRVNFTTNIFGGRSPFTYSYQYANGDTINGTNKTLALTFKDAGEYTVIATVKDATGATVSAEKSISVANKVTASLASSADMLYLNDQVVFTASADYGFGDFTYEFKLKDGTLLTSSGNKASLSFSETGSYTVIVTATDRVGNIATAEKTVIVSDKMTVKLTASADSVYLGTGIKLTTTITGGFSTYSYSYAYSDGTAIGGTGSSVSITPKAAGTYTVIVTVKDKNNEVKTAQVTCKVYDKLTVTLTSANTMMYVGDTMLLNANGQGGVGNLSYVFTVDGETSLANKNNVAEFTPKEAGNYQITVEAMDTAGKSATASVTISVAEKLTLDLEASAAEGVPNTTFTFTANATGGFPTVSYTFTIDNNGKISARGNTATAVLTVAGVYTITVTAKDKSGESVSKSVKVKVESDLDVSFTASAYKVYTGDSITFTAKATGGTEPITYSFAYSDGTAIKSSGNTAVITPETAGRYTVIVTATDKFGNTATDRTNVTVDGFSELFNTSTVSADTIPLGSSVRLEGSCQGGTAPYNYEFYYKKSRNTDWLRINTSESYAMFTPTAATAYDLKVIVVDKRNVSVEKTFSLKAEKDLENTSTVSSNKIVVGTKVVLTGFAAGGAGGYQYAFYYKKSSKTAWTVIGEAFTTKSAAFRPGTATDYDVMIEVKDLDGTVASKTFKLSGKTPLVNKTTINTTEVIVGNKVVLKGAASGGESGYKYAFYYKKHNKNTWTTIGEAFTTKSAAFRPGTLTTYDVKAEVKDESGTVVEKTFTVNVVPESKDLTNDSTVNAETITLGDRIIVVGAASGGTPDYQYAFYYKKSKNTDWVTISEFSAQSGTFKPTAAIDYDVKVVVRDANKATTEKTFKITVNSAEE